jgi:hypothetical protein
VLGSSKRLDRLIARFQKGHIPMVLQTLAEGMADGTIDSALPPALLFLCTVAVGAVPQVVRRVAGQRLKLPGIDDEQFARNLVGVLFHGIGGELDQKRGEG